MKRSLLVSAILLVVVLFWTAPWLPGATRYKGRYIGSPFSGYQFSLSAGSLVVTDTAGTHFYISNDRDSALRLAGAKGELVPTGSPYLGYFGAEEVRTYGTRTENADQAIFLPSYGLWCTSKPKDFDALFELGSQVSYFGPSLAMYLLVVVFFILFFAVLKKVVKLNVVVG